jgi:kynureninase
VTDLASHYSRFRVSDRILLTGHSHQAWPDVAFDGQARAWVDAAELVDDKWERAAAVADEVRFGWRRLLNDPQGTIALGQNTHELVFRLLTALLPTFGAASISTPVRSKLLVTDGEFHTIRRQLDRIAEEGVDVVKVAARPVDSLAERLAARVDDRTACILVSSVLFETAEIVPNLKTVADACSHHGAALLVDAYHHLNVIPFDVHAMRLATAYVTGGGYKYCQLGEGNCFLRLPEDTKLRPVFTGWFSEFAHLSDVSRPGEVPYGEGAARFAGATYDPTAHYRAAAVFAFHDRLQLTPPILRAINQRQVGILRDEFIALGVDPAIARVEAIPDERRGGFLAIRSSRAVDLVAKLRARDVWSDARGNVLRLGPAPYITDRQLRDAISALNECL